MGPVHQAPLHRKDMLLLLSLAASALAAPQMTYWNPYVVPHVYNQQPIVYAQHGVFGINVYMCVDGYNVDGSNSKTAVDGIYVAIQDTTSTATTVGCGTAVLA